MANILTEIVDYKRKVEIPRQRQQEPLNELEQQIKRIGATLDFEAALRQSRVMGASTKISLIAEVKKASPSKGLLCPNFDPARLATAYFGGGASALSVLTDEKYFMGQLDYILACKVASDYSLPILRKDFIVDPYQVAQARAYGADAILLIMACLEDALAHELFGLAQNLGLGVLVEVHDEAELERALRLGASIIGVNNRDLTTFKVDLGTTARVAHALPADFAGVLVSESGISSYTEIVELSKSRVNTVLVGETLVRAASIKAGLDTSRIGPKIRQLFTAEKI